LVVPTHSVYQFTLLASGIEIGQVTNTHSLAPPNQKYGVMALDNLFKAEIWRSENPIETALGGVINAPSTKKLINDLLAGQGATLNGDITTQMLFWYQVPYMWKNPNVHPWTSMLIEIEFKVHIPASTSPFPHFDADADVSIFVFPSVANGQLSLNVDGVSVSLSGGFPIGQQISDAVFAKISGQKPMVQNMLNALAAFAPKNVVRTYLLPGDGTAAPGASVFSGNVTLGVVPS
jgi:hypothetical protein